MCFICSHWDNVGYGNLLDDVNFLPHKHKDLKVKTHPLPPRLPADDDSAEEDSDMEYIPPADSGWFARIEAKLVSNLTSTGVNTKLTGKGRCRGGTPSSLCANWKFLLRAGQKRSLLLRKSGCQSMAM
jgi:hypothetical protein